MKLSDVSFDLKSLVLGAVVGGLVMLSIGAGTTTGSPSPVKWDYKVAVLPPNPALGGSNGGPDAKRESQQTLLNECGKDGWELVSQAEGRAFYFKRSSIK